MANNAASVSASDSHRISGVSTTQTPKVSDSATANRAQRQQGNFNALRKFWIRFFKMACPFE
jgi:hypothetical protein